jgi:hypothetical protein
MHSSWEAVSQFLGEGIPDILHAEMLTSGRAVPSECDRGDGSPKNEEAVECDDAQIARDRPGPQRLALPTIEPDASMMVSRASW